MNNYTKTLPVTGGMTIFGLALWQEIGIVFILTAVTVYAVRYFWRKNKNIGQ